jgi:hypothetical protein
VTWAPEHVLENCDVHCCSIVPWNVDPSAVRLPFAQPAAVVAGDPLDVLPLLSLPQPATPIAATALMPTARMASETFTRHNLQFVPGESRLTTER